MTEMPRFHTEAMFVKDALRGSIRRADDAPEAPKLDDVIKTFRFGRLVIEWRPEDAVVHLLDEVTSEDPMTEAELASVRAAFAAARPLWSDRQPGSGSAKNISAGGDDTTNSVDKNVRLDDLRKQVEWLARMVEEDNPGRKLSRITWADNGRFAAYDLVQAP